MAIINYGGCAVRFRAAAQEYGALVYDLNKNVYEVFEDGSVNKVGVYPYINSSYPGQLYLANKTFFAYSYMATQYGMFSYSNSIADDAVWTVPSGRPTMTFNSIYSNPTEGSNGTIIIGSSSSNGHILISHDYGHSFNDFDISEYINTYAASSYIPLLNKFILYPITGNKKVLIVDMNMNISNIFEVQTLSKLYMYNIPGTGKVICSNGTAGSSSNATLIDVSASTLTDVSTLQMGIMDCSFDPINNIVAAVGFSSAGVNAIYSTNQGESWNLSSGVLNTGGSNSYNYKTIVRVNNKFVAFINSGNGVQTAVSSDGITWSQGVTNSDFSQIYGKIRKL